MDINLNYQEVLKLFQMILSLLKVTYSSPQRWIIDFNDMSIEEAICYQLPFRYVKATVKQQRDKTQDIEAIKYGGNTGVHVPEMRKAIAPLSYYFNIPRHSKWFIFVPTQLNWLPGDSTAVVASDDFYILGILTSKSIAFG